MDKNEINNISDEEILQDKDSNVEDNDELIEDESLEENKEVFTYTVDNNNINNDYNVYGDNKSYIYIFIGIAILIGIIIMIVTFVNKSSSSDYDNIMNKMIIAAEKYYDKNNDMLPLSEDVASVVSSDTLIQNNYMKPFSEFVKDDISCTGSVSVYKSNDEYVYFPTLDCGDAYKTISLIQHIKDNSLVTDGDGLYEVNQEYIFKGEYPNNYVSFDDKTWRIVKINKNNTIKLVSLSHKLNDVVWDDRYNSSSSDYSGINDFRVSRLLEYLNKSYNENNIISKNNKKYLAKHNWCIGKLSQDNHLISSINLCNDVYGDLYVGLLQADEIYKASLDKNCLYLEDGECTNYNYFAEIGSSWTMNASTNKTYNVYYVANAMTSYRKASSSMPVIPVVNINSNILYSKGDGTKDNPYVIGD